MAANPVEPDLALHQSLPELLRNLRNLLRNPVEPDLALHQSLRDLLRNLRNLSQTLLNLTRCLHQCTPELFWAEDPISLGCWGKTRNLYKSIVWRLNRSAFFSTERNTTIFRRCETFTNQNLQIHGLFNVTFPAATRPLQMRTRQRPQQRGFPQFCSALHRAQAWFLSFECSSTTENHETRLTVSHAHPKKRLLLQC